LTRACPVSVSGCGEDGSHAWSSGSQTKTCSVVLMLMGRRMGCLSCTIGVIAVTPVEQGLASRAYSSQLRLAANYPGMSSSPNTKSSSLSSSAGTSDFVRSHANDCPDTLSFAFPG